MTFEIGSWVKWKDVCPIRLGHKLSDIGQVVGVHGLPAQGAEIDVEFDNGDVVHNATGDWFEPASPPAAPAEHDRFRRP
jgi:hypothetical protein